MTPSTSFILPSNVNPRDELTATSHPLLIVSKTPIELVTFVINYARGTSLDDRIVFITTQNKSAFTSSLVSSVFFSSSSSLTSASSIFASDNVTIYHVDTLAHLRVLLSSLQHSPTKLLAIDNFVSLHEQAAELTAQGISRTLAAMINIISCSSGILVLREPQHIVDQSVPVLNSGISTSLSSSTVPVNRVLGRWIRAFWLQGDNSEGDCFAEYRCQGKRWRVTWTLQEGQVNDIQILPR